MLTGGFYAEIQLEYDSTVAQEKGGRAFGVRELRPIQLSKRGVLGDFSAGRSAFGVEEWKALLLRSIGLEPGTMSDREQDLCLLRMVPFVQRNYNAVELGPRGTGKSHLYQQVSPYAHLISGGKATVARMFVNNATGQRGLVAQYDVICFDEIAGVSFDQRDGINIMKGYMESGEFSRGRESIRASGSVVFVGNFEIDVGHQQRVGHLFGPLPKEVRDDTAFMDRVHAYIPGWDVPKMKESLFTNHFGLVNDFLSECFSLLRSESRLSQVQGRLRLGGALSGRDASAVHRTMDGLLKLLYPSEHSEIPDDDIEWATRLAIECRRRVKEQQKRIGSAEFRNTQFSYSLGEEGVERFVATPEIQSDGTVSHDPLPPGQIWAIGPGQPGEHAGLHRIDVSLAPGTGVRITNVPSPGPFRESVRYAAGNLTSRAIELVGDRNPNAHEFLVQLRSFDTSRSGAFLGLPSLLALCSALLGKSLKGGLVAVGGLNLGGAIDPVYDPVSVAELAVEKAATALLIPITARKQLNELSDEMATRLTIHYYNDLPEALLKALAN
jgi:ATP-dependent Lon protease